MGNFTWVFLRSSTCATPPTRRTSDPLAAPRRYLGSGLWLTRCQIVKSVFSSFFFLRLFGRVWLIKEIFLGRWGCSWIRATNAASGWILVVWYQKIIWFSMWPLWPQILCKRKMISSFDILSVSLFVFAAARPHEMFLRSNFIWSNPHEFCWLDGETCILCPNSPLSLCSWSNPVFLFLCNNKMQAQYDNDVFICHRWEADMICWLWLQVIDYSCISGEPLSRSSTSCACPANKQVAKLINHHSYSLYSIKNNHCSLVTVV